MLIASSLRKELAGDPLFDGVSFSLERRDRLALAGPNGAGKTTLLRMITGETSIDGGDLALEKGTRIALHDQRPPLDRDLSLREYVLSGASDLVSEAALAIEMGAVRHDVSLTVHPHPTLPEAIMEAAKAALGEAIHIINR